MPLGQSQCIPQADPGGVATPRFWHRLIRFRHVISGSLTLASLNLTRRDIIPTLTATLTTIAFDDSSLQRFEAAPDCRPRRTYLHLSYSCAAPFGPAVLVT